MITKNQYLITRAKALDVGKGLLESMLVSLGNDLQDSTKAIFFLREKQENINALESA